MTRQYARFFFGAANEDTWHAALHGLESNWQGTPNHANTVIPATLALLEKATAGGNPPIKDWRAQMYLKRGCNNLDMYQCNNLDMYLYLYLYLMTGNGLDAPASATIVLCGTA